MLDNCITIAPSALLRAGSGFALDKPSRVWVIREEETDSEIKVEVMYRARSAPCPHCGQRTPNPR